MVIIRNGIIVDGTACAPYIGDILIVGNKIKKISKTLPDNLDHYAFVINANWRLVTPGFVDIHRHCDYAILKENFGNIELAQGITSAITGSCGLTPFPLRMENKEQLEHLLAPCLGFSAKEDLFYYYHDYANFLKTSSLPINIGNFIGSCSVRIAVKGFSKTPFSKEEMEQAKMLIKGAMEVGAFGVSMGIMYMPEYYSTIEELVEIASTAAKLGGILTCHIRGEGDTLVASVKEIITIAKKAEIPLQISHFKSCGMQNWEREIYSAIALIEKERDAGMDISVDFYPYTGGATTLLSLIPPCFMRSSLQETLNFMSSDKAAKELEEMVCKTYEYWDNYILSLGFERITITSATLSKNKQYIGKTLAEIIKEGKDPYRFICDILSEEQGKVGIIVMSMSNADVDTIAKLPYSFVISDSLYSDDGVPHPRLYSSFPKILRDFVKIRKVLTLPEAIQKMTSMPAKKIMLKNRGKIKEGYFADINIFDLNHVNDNADFANPNLLASGMDFVLLNGQIVWERERFRGRYEGKYLRK